ncbi:MAG: three-Cys-motif partner protein TcmP [Dehalococcoidia bacterium]|nr:three-Cys-motif partner protein TcmP [Dehalococcoidia bacterium]
MQIPEHYKNREQALVKHTLLKLYLEKLFMIIGQNERSISYVDCFAGPWQEGSSDLEDTSVAISLNIIKRCKESLASRSKDVRFKALYIEKNPEAYSKLESFVKREQWEGIEVEARQGDFYELRSDIRQWCNDDSFTFFFVDPAGWKDVVEIDTLRPLLERPKSEFLINFMFDFIRRGYPQATLSQHMRRIFGTVRDISALTPEEREEYLISAYQENLKHSLPSDGPTPRSTRVKVQYPLKDRTMYYLVYLTRHPLGIVEFMEESEKVALIQRIVRAEAKQQHRIDESHQAELWSASEFESGEYAKTNLAQVKTYWLSKLPYQPKRFGISDLADMLEETGWFISDFQAAFRELQSENKAKNLDARRNRPTNVVHFHKKNHQGEYLQKL